MTESLSANCVVRILLTIDPMAEVTPAPAGPEPRLPRRRLLTRWWAVLGLAAGLTLLIAALLAAGLSKALWGYWFVRPGVDGRVLAARQVHSVTFLDHQQQAGGPWALVPTSEVYQGPGWYQREKAQYPQEYDYYLLERRALRGLERRGVLTGPVPSLTAAELPDVAELLAAERRGFERTLERQANGPPYSGAVYRLTGAGGERLLLLAVSCCAVSNDHHPYYELLFEELQGAPPRLLSTTRFYFDIAGLEGVEFPQIFRGLSVAGLGLVLPLTGVVLLVRRGGAAGAIRRGLCPRCRYDLGGGLASGCPECGWGRGERAEVELDLRGYGFWRTLGQRLSAPPGWVTLALALAGSGMALWGWSTPGRSPGWYWLGLMAWYAALALTALKFVLWLVALVRRRARRRVGRDLARFAVPVLLAGGTYWALWADLALRWRFALSRSAMDRLVAGMPYPPGGAPQSAGLYRVYNVFQNGPTVFVLVGGMNLYYANGFVCFPGGKPAQPAAFGKRLECTPIGGGWYLFRYLK